VIVLRVTVIEFNNCYVSVYGILRVEYTISLKPKPAGANLPK
jgi:hypothetical protein